MTVIERAWRRRSAPGARRRLSALLRPLGRAGTDQRGVAGASGLDLAVGDGIDARHPSPDSRCCKNGGDSPKAVVIGRGLLPRLGLLDSDPGRKVRSIGWRRPYRSAVQRREASPAEHAIGVRPGFVLDQQFDKPTRVRLLIRGTAKIRRKSPSGPVKAAIFDGEQLESSCAVVCAWARVDPGGFEAGVAE